MVNNGIDGEFSITIYAIFLCFLAILAAKIIYYNRESIKKINNYKEGSGHKNLLLPRLRGFKSL
jgi:hypothetical protein